MAQNIEKINLYKELNDIVETFDKNGKEYIQCKRILKDLHEGFKV